MSELSYDVKVWDVESRRGTKGTIVSHRVTWKVSGQPWRKTFRTKALANAHRSALIAAIRNGEGFLTETGLPASLAPRQALMSWYEFTLLYTDSKWPTLSPNSRRSVAEALTDACEALMTGPGQLPLDDLRAALRWSYSTRIRDSDQPPEELTVAIRWLTTHTVRMDAFTNRAGRSQHTRAMLIRIAKTKSGSEAAANTANRKRMVLHNAMEYACEIGLLDDNPLKHVRWSRPRSSAEVDPRVVINGEQAQRFLAAVEADGERGRRLKAFFACMYYAALRPEEASVLRRSSLILPSAAPGWGEIQLFEARPRSGSRWTNTGEIREEVALKHRAKGETRRVPMHPELADILSAHIAEFGMSRPDALLFVGAHSGPVTDRTYLRVFHRARTVAFTDEEAASPLMDVPYSLRHAAVSTWLRTTGDPAQVARWAGHSVAVLLRVYARCVVGTEGEALDRIWAATRRDGETGAPGSV